MKTGTAESYATFTRTWWRYDANGQKVPGAGPRRYHGRKLTEDEARRMCQEWNSTHKPGPLSRKMEFEYE